MSEKNEKNFFELLVLFLKNLPKEYTLPDLSISKIPTKHAGALSGISFLL